MTTRALILATTAALTALTLASPLAASNGAGKTPLSVKLKEKTLRESGGSGTFTLSGASAADSDSGTLTFTESYGKYGKTPEGLPFVVFRRTEALAGKHGKIVIRSSIRVFDVGVVDEDDMVATGTWSIASATGKYAGLTGGGGAVGILRAVVPHAEAHVYSYRYEGLVTRS